MEVYSMERVQLTILERRAFEIVSQILDEVSNVASDEHLADTALFAADRLARFMSWVKD